MFPADIPLKLLAPALIVVNVLGPAVIPVDKFMVPPVILVATNVPADTVVPVMLVALTEALVTLVETFKVPCTSRLNPGLFVLIPTFPPVKYDGLLSAVVKAKPPVFIPELLLITNCAFALLYIDIVFPLPSYLWKAICGFPLL